MPSVGQRIVGSGKNRSPHDFYPTPRNAIEALLEREKFTGRIWEPAAGDGAISKVLCEYGHAVISTDLYGYGFCEGGIDFLNSRTCVPNVASIVTNPPYREAAAFVRLALERTSDRVAMLLRLNFLEGQKRKSMFASTPLETVYVFSSRLSFAQSGTPAKRGMITYAWFIWRHGFTGKPTLGWIG